MSASIPWRTATPAMAAAPAAAAPTFPSGSSWSQGSPGWAAFQAQQAQANAAANASNPTYGMPTGQSAILSPAQIQQWQNYFNAGAGGTAPGTTGGVGGGQPTYSNELVQTGSQYSPTIPWLTGGAGIGGIIGGSGATNAQTNLALPWQSLGIEPSSNPQTMANNINASPYSGSNPADPYYNLILNQAGAGTQTPTYTPQQVQTGVTPGGPSQYAQMVGGQLIGNATPQEQALMNYFGLSGTQSQYIPDIMTAIQAAPASQQASGPAQFGIAEQTLLNQGAISPYQVQQQNYG